METMSASTGCEAMSIRPPKSGLTTLPFLGSTTGDVEFEHLKVLRFTERREPGAREHYAVFLRAHGFSDEQIEAYLGDFVHSSDAEIFGTGGALRLLGACLDCLREADLEEVNGRLEPRQLELLGRLAERAKTKHR
jgi:hypothetical protein